MIRLQNVRRQFGEKVLFDGLNLELERGAYASIVGASGAGKSTLLNIIGTLDAAFTGTYDLDGCRVTGHTRSALRNRYIGFVFQSCHLVPNITARENVCLPYAYYRGNIPHIEQKIQECFDRFGIGEIADQVTSTLSGGEKQRVALIRSIILDPPVILADEPTGNLDAGNAKIVMEFLQQMNRAGKTVVTVTHDPAFARAAKQHFMIRNGKLIQLT